MEFIQIPEPKAPMSTFEAVHEAELCMQGPVPVQL